MAFSKHKHYSPRLQRISGKCKALAHPARLDILMQLMKRDKYVYEIVTQSKLTQGSVSGHLEILRRHGLITVEVQGLYNKYKFNIENLEWVRRELGNYIHYLRRIERAVGTEDASMGGGKRKGGKK